MNVTFILPNITLSPANAFSSISPIYQLIIIPGPAQISLTPPTNLLQQLFDAYPNLYIQIPSIRMPNKMLLVTIIAQFVKICDNNSNSTGKVYYILDDKI